MQELRDGGSVAMLSAVNDLYELLTFNEVMQDISIKDTEIMNIYIRLRPASSLFLRVFLRKMPPFQHMIVIMSKQQNNTRCPINRLVII